MNSPNLFEYATSELSQDASICWLISWASSEYASSDPALHKCAVSLLKTFFKKHSRKFSKKIESVEIDKQKNNIDILVTIKKK